MLVLFDIDGTLISAGGVGRRALDRAFQDELGIAGALEGIRLHGNTDPLILAEAFTRHVGRSPRPGECERILDRYLTHLECALEGDGPYRVLPGVVSLLDALARHGGFALGLATGNIEGGARLKLQRGALWSYFAFGGYGSDAAERIRLVECGIERGQAYARDRLGRHFELSEVVVIGDTERDVAAARGAGARAVGVRAGSTYVEALEASGPDLMVDALDAPSLHAFLGL